MLTCQSSLCNIEFAIDISHNMCTFLEPVRHLPNDMIATDYVSRWNIYLQQDVVLGVSSFY